MCRRSELCLFNKFIACYEYNFDEIIKLRVKQLLFLNICIEFVAHTSNIIYILGMIAIVIPWHSRTASPRYDYAASSRKRNCHIVYHCNYFLMHIPMRGVRDTGGCLACGYFTSIVCRNCVHVSCYH